MKFKLGFAAGLAAGYWLGSTPADQRKAKLDEMWTGLRDDPRVQRVTETVTTEARRLGDTVEQRFVSRTDAGGTAESGSGSDIGTKATSSTRQSA